MTIPLSQQSAMIAAERKPNYIHKPLYVVAKALVRRGYAEWHGAGGNIRLTLAGVRFARFGRTIE